jgi:hypothetical protein
LSSKRAAIYGNIKGIVPISGIGTIPLKFIELVEKAAKNPY